MATQVAGLSPSQHAYPGSRTGRHTGTAHNVTGQPYRDRMSA